MQLCKRFEALIKSFNPEIETEIVDKAREILFSEGGNADSLNYTTDTIYGMLYYLTGMCHLNWTDSDNV